MDTVDFIAKSKEMESLRNLCSNLNVDFRVILQSKDGVSRTIGTMGRKASEEVLSDSVPPEPRVISLPNLPYSYEELFLAEHQYEMVKFVLLLVQLYIGPQGILGEGTLIFINHF